MLFYKDTTTQQIKKAEEKIKISTLLPRSGNKKREFGLWAARAAHVGTCEA
jgi:hypothetical protein